MDTKNYMKKEVKDFIYDPKTLNNNIIQPDNRKTKEICIDNMKIDIETNMKLTTETDSMSKCITYNFFLKPYNCSEEEQSEIFDLLNQIVNEILDNNERIVSMKDQNIISCNIKDITDILNVESEDVILRTQAEFKEQNIGKKQKVELFYRKGCKEDLIEILEEYSTYKIYDHGSVTIER